jgi:pimeloyl-ACP methyl ester carboxylesterase
VDPHNTGQDRLAETSNYGRERLKNRKGLAMSNGTVTSTDGTMIAYERQGNGDPVIVVNTVAEDRSGLSGLAGLLAEHFTVYTYDRRGRGDSGDTKPYAPQREVEDLGAVIEAAGGGVNLISGSAGCVLCLDAATALGDAVRSLYLFEPPFIVNDGRPPMPAGYVQHLESLVATGDRSGAVEYFMTKALLIPAEFVAGLKADPSWASMERYAHTYAYDGRICAGTQEGRPLRRERWRTEAPVLVAIGENSEPYFNDGARDLADVLPQVSVETLPGQDHGALWISPEEVVASARRFFLTN